MDYKLDNGDRITLVVKTIAPPRSNFETLLREYLVKTYTEEQTEVILPAFMEVRFLFSMFQYTHAPLSLT